MVLDVIASALTVAEVAFKFIHHLSKFIEGAKKAGDISKSLDDKCALLMNTLEVVRITFTESQSRWKAGRPYALEGQIWRNVRQALRSGQSTLKVFQKDLKSVLEKSREGRELNWIAKAGLQLRRDSKEDIVTQFERDIDTNMHILAISMHCLNTRTMTSLVQNVPSLNAAIHSAENFVQSTPSSLPPCYSVSERDHRQARASMEKSIAIGKTIFTERNPNIYTEPDTIATADSEGQMVQIGDLERTGSSKSENDVAMDENEPIFDSLVTVPELMDGDFQEPDPNFDDRLPSTLLLAIWMSYCRRIHVLKEVHDFDSAVTYQRQLSIFLEDAPAMADKWRESQHALVELYEKQERVDEAKAILVALLRRLSEQVPATPTIPCESRIHLERTKKSMGEYAKVYFRLAEIQMLSPDRDRGSDIKHDPEKFAKRSVKLRWSMSLENNPLSVQIDRDLIEPLELLAKIWRSQKKCPAADAIEILCHRKPKLSPTASLNELRISLYDYRHQSHDEMLLINSTNDESTPLAQPHSPITEPYINRFLNGYTPLIIAVREKDLAKVSKKICKGADLELRSEEGKSPLLYAIESQTESIVSTLIEGGATVNTTCGDTTPLHHAVGVGDFRMVSLLLKLGADPELRSTSGTTPLFYAVGCGSPEVVEALLQGKADPAIAHGEERKTPLHRAVDINLLEVASVLIEHSGIDILKTEDLHERTPFECAVSDGRYQLVRLFLDSGVTIDGDFVSSLPRSEVKDLLIWHLKKQRALMSDRNLLFKQDFFQTIFG